MGADSDAFAIKGINSANLIFNIFCNTFPFTSTIARPQGFKLQGRTNAPSINRVETIKK